MRLFLEQKCEAELFVQDKVIHKSSHNATYK